MTDVTGCWLVILKKMGSTIVISYDKLYPFYMILQSMIFVMKQSCVLLYLINILNLLCAFLPGCFLKF